MSSKNNKLWSTYLYVVENGDHLSEKEIEAKSQELELYSIVSFLKNKFPQDNRTEDQLAKLVCTQCVK